MDFEYMTYKDDNMKFNAKIGDTVTFLGDKNESIINNLMFLNENNFLTIDNYEITKKNIDKLRQNIGFASIDQMDTFVSETVMDELAFNLESEAIKTNEMKSKIKEISEKFKLDKYLEKSPSSLDNSSKAKLSIARVVISSPKVLVIDNILKELDKDDKEVVIKFLKEFCINSIILNFTTEIEETLLGKRLIITDKDKILIEGETLSVLNEEKIMKRLGYNLPFIVLLNKYLKDYELIDRYYLDYELLGGALWK